MKKNPVLFFLLFAAGAAAAQPVTRSEKALVIGETRVFHSVVLNEDRRLNIFLPDSFIVSRSYPVFYLLDGSMNEDFVHISGLLQFFHLSYAMPDCIVVGIANVDRRRDFTFATDAEGLKKSFPSAGHSESFIRFLASELKPYIRSVYKTNGNDFLIGQSLGGLLAAEILLKKPELFSSYLIVSPSLWWDNESLLSSADSLLRRSGAALEGKRVFISAGGKEDPEMLRDAKQLAEKLEAAGKKNFLVHYQALPEEDHGTILHQAIDEDLKLIFPARNNDQ